MPKNKVSINKVKVKGGIYIISVVNGDNQEKKLKYLCSRARANVR